MAGLLHDIGKIATGEAILDKPGPLTDEEFDEIKKHPARGAETDGRRYHRCHGGREALQEGPAEGEDNSGTQEVFREPV